MRYQAILFDLDGTLLPMHEPTFVKYFYGALVAYLTPSGRYSPKEVGEILQGSLQYVVGNDGHRSNRQAFIDFYNQYERRTGVRVDIEDIEAFYESAFDKQVRHSCGYDPAAAMIVDFIKQENIPMVVATNPFFPCAATHARLRWAGLDPTDFAEITTYENYHYCKPNMRYYQEVFARTGFDPEQCLMVGNNVDEDMIAKQLGCDVFLIDRNLINPENKDISQYPSGSLDDLHVYLQQNK